MKIHRLALSMTLLTFSVMGYAQQQQPPSNGPKGTPVAVTADEQKDLDIQALKLDNLTMKYQLFISKVQEELDGLKKSYAEATAALNGAVTRIKAAHGYGSEVIFDVNGDENGVHKLIRVGSDGPNNTPSSTPQGTSLNAPTTPGALPTSVVHHKSESGVDSTSTPAAVPMAPKK